MRTTDKTVVLVQEEGQVHTSVTLSVIKNEGSEEQYSHNLQALMPDITDAQQGVKEGFLPLGCWSVYRVLYNCYTLCRWWRSVDNLSKMQPVRVRMKDEL